MRKIRIGNDIDIVVRLRNDQGEVLDPTLSREYDVCLKQLSERIRIEDYELFPDGRIGFRFRAGDQRRTGVYSITISAAMSDGRKFTTDVCNAFALVRRSCETENDSAEVELVTVEVDASFEITAWSGGDDGTVQTSLKYYDDGSGEVVPVKHPDLSTQPSILPYKFAGNYVYEQMFYVTSKQIYDSLDAGHIVELGKTEIQNVLVIDSFISCATHYGNTRTAPSSFIIYGTANSIELYVQSLEDASALIDEGLESCWIRVVYTTNPKAGGYYGGYGGYYGGTQEDDYIRFLNNTQYDYGVIYNYSHYSSGTEIHAGYELVLDGELLDDFKNNKMFITLGRTVSSMPETVILRLGNRTAWWVTGQPLFYSAEGGGGLTFTQLFGNVERCLITMEQG